jgi:predicted ABC-type ATPase
MLQLIMPQIFMISGPNGAGKTTASMDLLPDILHCEEYINADAIAAGLSPFKTEEMAFFAGRLMLERINQLTLAKVDFAFETTGASRFFAPFLSNCKKNGYIINLLYLWLESPELALERVAARVEKGGHNIPELIVRRRYKKGIANLFNLYVPIADNWALYDNSAKIPKLVAHKKMKSDIIIVEKEKWQLLNEKNYGYQQ